MNVQAAEDLVDFGERLEHECSRIGQLRPTPCNVALTCTAARTLLPPPMAASLFSAAQIMVRWAYEAVECGPGGRIGVSFHVTPGTLELTVEHSHPISWGAMREGRDDAALLQQAVALAGGHVEARKVIGGCRWVIVIPSSLSSASRFARGRLAISLVQKLAEEADCRPT